MKTKSSNHLYQLMKEGTVYRRKELTLLSKAVDRELKELIKDRKVQKAGSGIYVRPRMSRFGPLPLEHSELVRAFLKTDDFLLTSPNVYNGLGLGLTQLSNEMVVYNRKRVGKFELGGFVFIFKRPINFPKNPSKEFFFVDLLNNLEELYDPPDNLLSSLGQVAKDFSRTKLERNARVYGKKRSIKMLKELILNESETIAP